MRMRRSRSEGPHRLPVVQHAGGGVHRRHESGALLDAARANTNGEVIGDADEFLSLFLVEPQLVGVDLHSASAASAFRSGGASTPARKRRNPAAAIIAALSVDSATLGRNVGLSRCSP